MARPLIREVVAAGLTVALICLAQACAAQADPVATRWLLSSCTVGDARVDAELRSAGASAADTLLRAYRNGSGRLADDVETNAGKEYDRIIDALDHGRTYGLSPAEVSDIRRETRAVHMRHARD